MALVQVFPLAEYVCDEMLERGWKTGDVAIRMPGDYATNLFCVELLLAVQDDGMKINDEIFDGLATALDVSEPLLRKLHDIWQKSPDRRTTFVAPEAIFTGGEFPKPH